MLHRHYYNFARKLRSYLGNRTAVVVNDSPTDNLLVDPSKSTWGFLGTLIGFEFKLESQIQDELNPRGLNSSLSHAKITHQLTWTGVLRYRRYHARSLWHSSHDGVVTGVPLCHLPQCRAVVVP